VADTVANDAIPLAKVLWGNPNSPCRRNALFALAPPPTPGAPYLPGFGRCGIPQVSPLKPFAGRQLYRGAPRSHQRTWAENDGRSPTTAVRSGSYTFSSRPERFWALSRHQSPGAPSFAFFAKGGIVKSRPSVSHNSRHNGKPG
jgi:hypothetical protein